MFKNIGALDFRKKPPEWSCHGIFGDGRFACCHRTKNKEEANAKCPRCGGIMKRS